MQRGTPIPSHGALQRWCGPSSGMQGKSWLERSDPTHGPAPCCSPRLWFKRMSTVVLACGQFKDSRDAMGREKGRIITSIHRWRPEVAETLSTLLKVGWEIYGSGWI